MNLLVVAYAYSPSLGSEYRSAWNVVEKYAESGYSVHVVCGDADGAMGSFSSLDAGTVPVSGTTVHRVSHPLLSVAHMLLQKLKLGIFFGVLLKAWMWFAFYHCKIICDEHNIDAVHQLGPIGFRNPGFTHKLGVKSYWGPIGGAQTVDLECVSQFELRYRLAARFRNLDLLIRSRSNYIAQAAKSFDNLSFATPETRDYFKKHYGKDGALISDQGANANLQGEKCSTNQKAKGRVNVAWIGSLDGRKNTAMLCDIATGLPNNVHLKVVGSGGHFKRVQRRLQNLHNVSVVGQARRDVVQKILKNSDCLLVTSHSEASSAVLFEGIENNCVPVVPDRNGFNFVLNDTNSFKIPTDTYTSMLKKYREVFFAVATDPVLLETMSERLEVVAEKNSWTELARKHERNIC